jgi:polyvinyl alcohol dehydrogenase (cytochrome)
VIWSISVGEAVGKDFSYARVTPAIVGNSLILGTQVGSDPDGARVFALNKNTGEVQWVTKVDDHPASRITQSPQVFGSAVFVGVSSAEEGFAANPAYECCSFRGSMLRLNRKTGEIEWKTYMTPDLPDFSGNAVWGSTPAIDPSRNSVFIATGNNYTVPQEILDCVENNMTAAEVIACVEAVPGSAENYIDAVVSLDMNTGSVNWATSVLPFDAWTVACFFTDEGNCPDPAGPDFDFGQAPALFKAGGQELLGVGQKSGIYWALNPDNGDVIWSTQAGPGGITGGLQWGSSTDGNRVYTAVANSSYEPYVLQTGPNAGDTIHGGFWTALDAATGARIWEAVGGNPPPFPPSDAFPFDDWPDNYFAQNQAAVSSANGVMYAGALNFFGTMFAFDAATGDILWSFDSGASVNSGPAIVGGNVYWGNGYRNIGAGTGSGGAGNAPLGGPSTFYAFHVATSENAQIDNPPQLIPANHAGYALSQNIPNPVAERTEVHFTVPETVHVNISIYSNTGVRMATLVNEERAQGNYKVTWDASGATPGMYLLHMQAGANLFTRIVIVSG